MSAPLCTVTPLEALRRLYDVARKVDAKESGEFETLLQGELLVAESVLNQSAIAKSDLLAIVCAALDPWTIDDGTHYQFNQCALAVVDAVLRISPQPAASVTDADLVALLPGPYYMDLPDGGSVPVLEQLQRMAKDAARLDFLDRCVMNHRCISAERDRDGTVGSPTYGDLPTVTIFTIPSQHKKGVGLRGAIDAAIAAQQGEKTK